MAQFRAVTERDLRAPEFRDCEPEDMEWRADGTLARKDRWEVGIRQIAGILTDDPGDLAAQIRDEDAVRDLAELIFHADPDMEVALAKLVTSTITPAVTHALRARPNSPLARSRRTR